MAALAAAEAPPLQPGDCVVVFLKVPLKGKSKTRLIPTFGEVGALALARAMAQDTLRRLGSDPRFCAARLVACFAPVEAREGLDALVAGSGSARPWEPSPMTPHDLTRSDLGTFLAAEYARVRDASPGAVVILGMDAPDLPLDRVCAAAAAARSGRAAVGDAADGGYVFVALPPAAPPSVFEGIAWSAPTTAASQRAALAREGVPVAPAAERDAPWPDVDEAGDVHDLFRRLAAAPGDCPHLDALADSVSLLLTM
jgi:hypothetical protein